MFEDYPHNIKQRKGKLQITKTLDNKKVLKKEFLVQKYIEPLGISPEVHNFNGNSFQEEVIKGTPLANIPLSNSIITEVAVTIKRFHSLELNESIKQLLVDKYIVNDKYNPLLLFKAMIDSAPEEFRRKFESKLERFFKNMKTHFNKKDYSLSIIHGDLSKNNILQFDGQIKIIDWSDCRRDIPSADVSQFFYLNNLNGPQRRIFLKNYASDFIDDEVLIAHEVLLLLYDIVDLYKKDDKISSTLIKKIKMMLN